MQNNELRIFVEMLKLLMENEEQKKMIETLESRLGHLLESEYIRKFDAKDPHTREYLLPIKEADDTAPVKYGLWIHCNGKSNLWHCSNCGGKIIYNPTRLVYKGEKRAVHEVNEYCRSCGVKMIGHRVRAAAITIPHPTREIGRS